MTEAQPPANTKVYVNGAYKASDDETRDNRYEDESWQIGAHGNSAYEWVGDVDEVRLYKETLSADWIKFEYRNIAEADNELTWAAEEDAPEASPPSELIGNPYMFTGRRFDLETGLYYYRARYYNPYIGRFLQTDPMGYGDGMNWYNYCANNPASCLDPSGLEKVRIRGLGEVDIEIDLLVDTYFMFFIDSSGSMDARDEEGDITNAILNFVKILAELAYDNDLNKAHDHVIVNYIDEQTMAEQDNLGKVHVNERWLWGLQEFKHDDDEASRYVNYYFTDESAPQQGLPYYYGGSEALDETTDYFVRDYDDMVEEIGYRTFSIGKVFNIGGIESPGSPMNTHLENAFDGVGEYGELYDEYGWTLQDMGLSYENVGSNLSLFDYMGLIVNAIDSDAAYTRNP